MRKNGKLICFEGLDGAGKTTIAKRVASELEKEFGKVLFIEKKSPNFAREYLTKRMSLLQHVIWECGDDPIYELGDEHSLYIMASWFAVLDHCKVRPLLAEGITLVVDNWFYKLISRFKLKSTVDFAHVKRCFETLYRPDCIVFLDVSPTVAAHRKDVFSLAEAGNLDGLSGRTRDNFVRYQASYRDVLREFATANSSITVKVDGRLPDEITDEIVHRLRETLSETT